MKRVLLTGMSGTGKSSVIQALSARGFKAVDTDDGWCEPLPDGRQRWREDAIGQLLDTEDAGVQFVADCEENQVRFHPRFDLIILLSAPAEVLADPLTVRPGRYGQLAGAGTAGLLGRRGEATVTALAAELGRSARWTVADLRASIMPSADRRQPERQRRKPAS